MKYAVRITRVIEEETWVTVEAKSEEDAEEKAMEQSDYFNWEWSDDVEDPEVAEVEEEK